MKTRPLNAKRPLLFENWRAAAHGKPPHVVIEHPLFTDADLSSEATFGAYRLINTIAHAGHAPIGTARPGLVLRVEHHIEFILPEMEKTETSTYHGGTLADEVAAITSLALGIRVTAGPMTRRFEIDDPDPRGRPVAYENIAPPTVFTHHRRLVLPSATGMHSLELLQPLVETNDTGPDEQTAFIRAARLYQEALWLCETAPSMAWLLLISAVETAADQWRHGSDDPVEQFKTAKPDLARKITAKCPALLDPIAREFVHTTGATKKFLTFMLEFLPTPPPDRPRPAFQVNWDNLKPALRLIYKYRSQALHSGTPFPAPMCEPPYFVIEGEAPPERQTNTSSSFGSVWHYKDIPMLLHIFEYLARRALVKWWQMCQLRTSP